MRVYEYGKPAAPVVLIQPVEEHDLKEIGQEVALIERLSGEDFRLIAVQVDHWNADLSPWEAPAVFRKEGFAGGAEKTFAEVTRFCTEEEKTYYIGGYSLAGLFALWAACRAEVFKGVAAASPSVWFPGFAEDMREHRIKSRAVYLSLGDREEKTRNPVMASVGEKIREIEGLLHKQGVDCVLEWNPGNHFQDAALRTAKAFAWVMKRR